jgi:hypothetical protein
MVRTAQGVVVLSAIISFPALALLLIVFYEILIAPPVMEYRDLPFTVETEVVHPGESISLIVNRCVSDPIAPDPVNYTFTRNLVRVDGPVIKTVLPDGGSDADHGCTVSRSLINLIPENTPSGRYYVEGTSTVPGRFKVTIARWRSQEFSVDNPNYP